MLARAIKGHEEDPFHAMYTQMLVDKVEDDKIIAGRTPKMGELTHEILKIESIEVYLYYIDQLKRLFTEYHHENFNAKQKGAQEQ